MRRIKKMSKVKKVKSVNCYLKGDKKPFICIQFEGGDIAYINVGLLKYAVENPKIVGDKDEKKAR